MQITYYPGLNNNIQTLICNLPNYEFSKQSVTIVSGVQTVSDNNLKLLLLTDYFSRLVSISAIVLSGSLDSDPPIYPDAKPDANVLIAGITDAGDIVDVGVNSDGSLKSVDFGTKITDATMPTGGVGNLGWLSAVWKQLTDKLPALSNGKIPVEVGSLNVTVDNASLEIANDVGNPVPISAANLPLPTNAATSANQTTGNTSLASIDTKTPALGQALAAVSTPVVLPASQITALTPPTTVAINNTITLAAEAGYLTYRNTALTNAAVQVKASYGSVMGWNFINVNSVTVYVKFYNLATGVTVGTSPILLTQAVPGGSDSNPGINFLEASLIPQEVFSTGISIACVTGLADNSTTAPTTPIHASVRYK